jgi:hypothetical protein
MNFEYATATDAIAQALDRMARYVQSGNGTLYSPRIPRDIAGGPLYLEDLVSIQDKNEQNQVL